jgi:hypothetical protein
MGLTHDRPIPSFFMCVSPCQRICFSCLLVRVASVYAILPFCVSLFAILAFAFPFVVPPAIPPLLWSCSDLGMSIVGTIWCGCRA